MALERIQTAYREKGFPGSYFTHPLKVYHGWFRGKIDTSQTSWERVAWQISFAVSALFAALPLGLLAAVGIAINLCWIPPEEGYSLWARCLGVPKRVEEFCRLIQDKIELAHVGNMQNLSASSSSDRGYAYDKKQGLYFQIQDITQKDLHEVHSALIGNRVRDLSRRFSWYPETLSMSAQEGVVSFVIPIPDHISISNFNE